MLVLVTLVLGGLLALAYSAGWAALAPWLLPFLVPVVIGLVPGAGGVVVRQYLDAFGTTPDDAGVPLYWQFRAAAAWLQGLWYLLLLPAALGYLRLAHVPVRNRTVMAGLCAGAVIFVYATFNGTLLDSARREGRLAVEAAARWRTPQSYYGIEPTWVCATPLVGVEPERIPVVGGIFDPDRAYLMLGDSGGTVVLWVPDGGGAEGAQTLRLPLGKLRIREVALPEQGCVRR